MPKPILVLFALLALAAPAAAQRRAAPPLTLEVGDTVRVVAPRVSPLPLVGTLSAYRYNELTVRDEGSGEERTVGFPDVEKLARNTGKHRGKSALSGARRGAFLGGAVGAVSGPLLATGDTEDDLKIPGTTVLAAVGGTLVGGVVGGLLGWTLAREEWVEFQRPIVSTASWRAGGATSVGVSIRTH